jgi:hypothetical protein
LNIFAAPSNFQSLQLFNKTMTLSPIESLASGDNDSAHSTKGSLSGKQSGSTSQDAKSSRAYGAGMPDTILTSTERQIMRMSRIIVLVVIVLVAATATVLTWSLTTDWEKTDFETKVRINQSIGDFVSLVR